MRIRRLLAGFGAIALALALAVRLTAGFTQTPADPEPCRFLPAEITWLQGALDGWERVARRSLRIDPSPLPWIVLFDRACVWHIAADSGPGGHFRPVSGRLTFDRSAIQAVAASHQGMVTLPNRVPVAVEPRASTALYRNDRGAFFAMAMRRSGRPGKCAPNTCRARSATRRPTRACSSPSIAVFGIWRGGTISSTRSMTTSSRRSFAGGRLRGEWAAR